MPASLEHLVSIARIGPEHARYGDPYTLAVALRWLGPREVELIGVMRPPALSELRALYGLLADLGVREVRYQRIAGARLGWHVKRVQVR